MEIFRMQIESAGVQDAACELQGEALVSP